MLGRSPRYVIPEFVHRPDSSDLFAYADAKQKQLNLDAWKGDGHAYVDDIANALSVMDVTNGKLSSEGGHVPLDLITYSRVTNPPPEIPSPLSPETAKEQHVFIKNTLAVPKTGPTPPWEQGMDTSKPPIPAVGSRFAAMYELGKINYIRPKRWSFVENGIQVAGGEQLEFDVVIFATGYSTNIDYLDESVANSLEYHPEDRFLPMVAYKQTLHPDVPGLACVGLTPGPSFVSLEAQGRWAVEFFAGNVALPNKSVVDNYLHGLRELRVAKHKPGYAVSKLFADEIYAEMGATPVQVKGKVVEGEQVMYEGTPGVDADLVSVLACSPYVSA